MKIKLVFTVAALLLQVTFVRAQTQRKIAITIDDLPVVSTRRDLKTRQQITKNLLAHITKAKVPVIGFVNEKKLYAGDKRDEPKAKPPMAPPKPAPRTVPMA